MTLTHIALLALVWPGGFVWFLVLCWLNDRRPVSDLDRYCSSVDEDLDARR